MGREWGEGRGGKKRCCCDEGRGAFCEARGGACVRRGRQGAVTTAERELSNWGCKKARRLELQGSSVT
eukprot:339611-Chlamydomonas_euryale.AAC.1